MEGDGDGEEGNEVGDRDGRGAVKREVAPPCKDGRGRPLPTKTRATAPLRRAAMRRMAGTASERREGPSGQQNAPAAPNQVPDDTCPLQYQ